MPPRAGPARQRAAITGRAGALQDRKPNAATAASAPAVRLIGATRRASPRRRCASTSQTTARNRYEIEIHKKFSLAAACLIFVLVGAPIALRFPRGGVGLVIGVSLLVFALYYVGLIGGEALANKGYLLAVLGDVGHQHHPHRRRARDAPAHGQANPARRAAATWASSMGLACWATVRTRSAGAGTEDGMRHLVRPLDRYVFAEWMKIFVTTALGLPFLLVIIDLTDHLQTYLNRNIPRADIALSYVYWMPESMFMALPAAVLFATVFSIGTFTRHSEVTAAKASGISFYRLIAPILFGALLAAALDLAIGEVVPITDARRNDLLGENKVADGHAALQLRLRGRVRARLQGAAARRHRTGRLQQLQIERKGNGHGLSRPCRDHGDAARSTTAANGAGRCRTGEMHVDPRQRARLRHELRDDARQHA